MKKCFKFTKENSSSLGIVYRPIVKVGLKDANGDPFELGVLVDSGADISIFSRRIGDIMGINVEMGEEKIFRGIVGELIAYVHKIPISITDRNKSSFCPIHLLGRLDIFKNFEISFRKEDDLCFND